MPKIKILPSYENKLSRAGLDRWDPVMALSDGKVFKKNKHRSVVKLENGLFLKRHTVPELKDKVRDLLSGRRPLSDADQEFRNIMAVAALGIPTMKPVAWGEKGGGLYSPSFMITEDLGNLERLEELLVRRFTAASRSKRDREEKRRLILSVAGMVRRLHEADLFHHDLYCGHILVEEQNGSAAKLFLIDLQRVRPHTLFRRRWQAKDLSALDYTASAKALSRADRLRFFLAYLGLPWHYVPRLTPSQKKMIRQILRRTRRTAHHTDKKRARYLAKKQ